MTRPKSHRSRQHEKSCSNCKFSQLVAYKLDLLCFHEDDVEIYGQSSYPDDASHVYLGGEEVGLMGEEYDEVWASRIVDSDDLCDCWEKEE